MRAAWLTCQFTSATGGCVCKQIVFVCLFSFQDLARLVDHFPDAVELAFGEIAQRPVIRRILNGRFSAAI